MTKERPEEPINLILTRAEVDQWYESLSSKDKQTIIKESLHNPEGFFDVYPDGFGEHERIWSILNENERLHFSSSIEKFYTLLMEDRFKTEFAKTLMQYRNSYRYYPRGSFWKIAKYKTRYLKTVQRELGVKCGVSYAWNTEFVIMSQDQSWLGKSLLYTVIDGGNSDYYTDSFDFNGETYYIAVVKMRLLRTHEDSN